MPNGFDSARLDVVYAEDEVVFQEIAIPAFSKAGISRERIHMSEDGRGALDDIHSLQAGDTSLPIVVLLDLRMPGMDGTQCARKIQQLTQDGALLREPFVVCCSAGIRDAEVDDKAGLFQLRIPKPLGPREVVQVLDLVEKWWSSRSPQPRATLPPEPDPVPPPAVEAAAAGEALHSAPPVDLGFVLLADSEPICRMSVLRALGPLGIKDDAVSEADDVDEAVETLQEKDKSSGLAPLVLLGNPEWAGAIRAACTGGPLPYMVCTSMMSTSETPPAGFDAVLLRQFKRPDLEALLAQCRARR